MLLAPDIGLDGKIVGLDKALYGLKQAALTWFEKLSEALPEIGFISLPFDRSVFISADHKIIVVVYVDDITTAGSHSVIYRLIDDLHSYFTVTVKAPLKYRREIEITQRAECMDLSQQECITNILSRFRSG